MRKVKTYLRLTIKSPRLIDLTLISIERVFISGRLVDNPPAGRFFYRNKKRIFHFENVL